MPKTERNQALAESFGHCWHEIDPKWNYRCKLCGESWGGHEEGMFESYKTEDDDYALKFIGYHDYFTLVTLKCDKCGGSGNTEERVASRKEFHGYKQVPCPCQGKPRIISEFQRMVEERGEWGGFLESLHHGAWNRKDRLTEILTDLIKMADAYLKWRKETS